MDGMLFTRKPLILEAADVPDPAGGGGGLGGGGPPQEAKSPRSSVFLADTQRGGPH